MAGKPFNPYGLFNGIFIPEALVRAKRISPGGKLVYGRLTRYAGKNGGCFPAVPTLAAEIGLSVRQTQKYLAELESIRLIRRLPRISKVGQTSNSYEFLWHTIFDEGVTDAAPEGVNDATPEGVTDRSPKDSQNEENHFEETNIDLDSPPSNRKDGDSRPDSGAGSCKQYPRLREALADYMITPEDAERVYPADRQVVDLMDATAGVTEEAVIRCLRYLKDERGLRPGTKHGPRGFGWFKTVIAEYFQEKANREAVFTPTNREWDQRNGPGLSKSEFDAMTDAIELEGA